MTDLNRGRKQGVLAALIFLATGALIASIAIRPGTTVTVPPEVLTVVDEQLKLEKGRLVKQIDWYKGELDEAQSKLVIQDQAVSDYVRLVARLRGRLAPTHVAVLPLQPQPTSPASAGPPTDPCIALRLDRAACHEALRDLDTACVVSDFQLGVACRAEVAQVAGEDRLRGRLFGSAEATWLTNGNPFGSELEEQILEELEFEYVVDKGPKWRRRLWGGLVGVGDSQGAWVGVSVERKRWAALAAAGAVFDFPDPSLIDSPNTYSVGNATEPVLFVGVSRAKRSR